MRFPITILLISLSLLSAAQEFPRGDIDLNKIVDDLYGFQDLDLNYEDLYENAAQWLAHPLNLNKASEEEIRFLKILSDEQIANLTAYKKENGNLLTDYELQAVPGFDLETIYKLMPFVKVADPSAAVDASLWKRIRREGDNYIVFRYERTLQTKQGFQSDAKPEDWFLGSPDKLYMRLRAAKPGDFSFGFTSEKDAGEQIHRGSLDYNSLHLQLLNKGRIKNIVVGDYQCQFGQGIMLGGVFGMGKGGETITTTRRSNLGLVPYTSTYEAGFLRGVGSTVGISEHVTVTGFYSRTRRDGNLAADGEDDPVISSFQTTGLHRNQKEIDDRHTTGEQNIGCVVRYQRGQLDAGVMYNLIEFDSPVRRNPSLYNQFYFQGRQNQNTGLFVNYTFQNISFFSEMARSFSGGKAYVAGVLMSLTSKFDLSILHRKFDRDFYSFYSNAFAEGSLAQNEIGTYWGWKYRFNRRFSVSGYVDLFRFPWLRYRSYVPSDGYEGLFRFQYQPSRTITLFVQAREEVKVRNVSDEKTRIYTTSEGRKRNYWFSCDYPVTKNIRLKTRAQFSTFTFQENTTQGLVLLQDLWFSLWKIELTARHALFDTDDYDNRQYVYENDAWLAFSLPAYDGVGVRNYVLLEYKLNRSISFWFRYAHTRFTDREEIGSGAETIVGNKRSDLKFQVRIKF